MSTPWWTRGDRGPTSEELHRRALELADVKLIVAAAGDFFEVYGFQDSGGSRTVAWCSCGAGEQQPPELHSPPCPGAVAPEGYAV